MDERLLVFFSICSLLPLPYFIIRDLIFFRRRKKLALKLKERELEVCDFLEKTRNVLEEKMGSFSEQAETLRKDFIDKLVEELDKEQLLDYRSLEEKFRDEKKRRGFDGSNSS